jgi:hypothetical protein
MPTQNRVTTLMTVLALLAFVCPASSAKAEDRPKSREAPRTEYIPFEPGTDAAKASREFDAKWKATFISTPWPDYRAATQLLQRVHFHEGHAYRPINAANNGGITRVVA